MASKRPVLVVAKLNILTSLNSVPFSIEAVLVSLPSFPPPPLQLPSSIGIRAPMFHRSWGRLLSVEFVVFF